MCVYSIQFNLFMSKIVHNTFMPTSESSISVQSSTYNVKCDLAYIYYSFIRLVIFVRGFSLFDLCMFYLIPTHICASLICAVFCSLIRLLNHRCVSTLNPRLCLSLS